MERRRREFSGVMEMFYILIWVIVTQGHRFATSLFCSPPLNFMFIAQKQKYLDTGTPCFIELCSYVGFFFYRLDVCSNPALS